MSKCRAGKREQILSMFDYHCAYCGTELYDDNATLDHIKPTIITFLFEK